jgi:pimeloyl-ACP methyl ester carboxylesterase
MIFSTALRGMLPSIGIYVFSFATVLIPGQIILPRPAVANGASTKPPVIVIGFLGGFIAHDDPVHSVVQLAARLRKEYPTGVDVKTFESYRGERAEQQILKLLDTNHDGILTMEEKQNAQIILYGHSWGGAESIYLARALKKDGIPVLLTIQVDSVSRPGNNDTTIPANVSQAANFYQTHGLVHGDHDIRAADPAHTRIIGNFRFDYEKSSLNCAEYPWYARAFMKPHTQIECDPVVWDQVESLIRANLPPAVPNKDK